MGDLVTKVLHLTELDPSEGEVKPFRPTDTAL